MCPRVTSIADAAAAERARLVGIVLTSALQLGLALRATSSPPRTRRSASSSAGDRLVPGGQAPLRRHARARRGGARARCTQPRSRSTAAATTTRCAAAAAAKILAGDAAIANGKSGIQVHGGIGFTWEVDVQRFWKRACVLDTHFGNSDEHAEAVAAEL